MIRCARCTVPVAPPYSVEFMGKPHHRGCALDAALKLGHSFSDEDRCPCCALVPAEYHRLRKRVEKLEDQNSKHVHARLERLAHQKEMTDA